MELWGEVCGIKGLFGEETCVALSEGITSSLGSLHHGELWWSMQWFGFEVSGYWRMCANIFYFCVVASDSGECNVGLPLFFR